MFITTTCVQLTGLAQTKYLLSSCAAELRQVAQIKHRKKLHREAKVSNLIGSWHNNCGVNEQEITFLFLKHYYRKTQVSSVSTRPFRPVKNYGTGITGNPQLHNNNADNSLMFQFSDCGGLLSKFLMNSTHIKKAKCVQCWAFLQFCLKSLTRTDQQFYQKYIFSGARQVVRVPDLKYSDPEFKFRSDH